MGLWLLRQVLLAPASPATELPLPQAAQDTEVLVFETELGGNHPEQIFIEASTRLVARAHTP